MVQQRNICIVGNGIVGKAAALGLAQLGLTVDLVGATENTVVTAGVEWDTRVYALNHTAQNLLHKLKVWDALDLSRVRAVEAMTIRGGANSTAARLIFDAYSAKVDALAWIVEDANLHQALDAALKFAANVRRLVGRTKQMDVQAGAIQLESGEWLRADLIIGADGAQSWIRSQCAIGIDYRAYYQRGVVANFLCERPHHGIAYQWFTENDGIIALLPLPGQRVSLVWSAPEQFADCLLAGSCQQLAARVSLIASHDLGQLSPLQPERMQAFPLSLLKTHALIAPRVALIGDAAHVVHPLAGHGMNLGFADVVVLMQVLQERSIYQHCGEAAVLARYARLRKEEIGVMQVMTDSLARLFALKAGPLRLLCNTGLDLLDKIPFLKRQLMRYALGGSLQKNQEIV